MIAIMARLPFTISAANFDSLPTASLDVSTFKLRPAVAAEVPVDRAWDSSQSAAYATICAHPASGTSEIPTSPSEMSASLRTADGER